MKEIKFTDYEKQLKKLRNKGLNIGNPHLATELLKSNGYYNLINKYKEDWYESDRKYPPRTSLYDLYLYHRFEDDLRNILFRFTITFEKRLKESMAYIISKELGIYEADYLDPSKYRKRSFNKAKNVTAHLLEILENTQHNPTHYYHKNYDGVPPWILLNNISLGEARMLFSIFPFKMSAYVTYQLLPFNDDIPIEYYWCRVLNENQGKQLLAFYYDNNYSAKNENSINAHNKYIELVKNMVSIIHEFRNTLAHGHRLIHTNSKTKLKLDVLRVFADNNVFSDEEFYSGLGKNDLFSFLLSLLILLNRYDAKYFLSQLEDWVIRNTKTSDVRKIFNKFIVKSCKLPNDFISRLSKVNILKTDKERDKEYSRIDLF